MPTGIRNRALEGTLNMSARTVRQPQRIAAPPPPATLVEYLASLPSGSVVVLLDPPLESDFTAGEYLASAIVNALRVLGIDEPFPVSA